jgi:hypothetical protein
MLSSTVFLTYQILFIIQQAHMQQYLKDVSIYLRLYSPLLDLAAFSVS